MNATGGRVLIVDDDAASRELLETRLGALNCDVEMAADGRQALVAVRREPPSVMLLDLQMPGMDGMEVLQALRLDGIDIPVIVITAHGSIESAVAAMKQGAYDFILKPFDPKHLEIVVRKALERENLKREVEVLSEEVDRRYQLVVGKSAGMTEAVTTAKKAAASKSTVLLLGESGTGKEIFARSIHNWSERNDKPFIAINCVGLSKELLESELFGHEKGAFTGAQYRKKGKFEIADGGTVFLDEISDISLKTQTDLLRVLQEKEIVRVGGNQQIKVDFRAIAATNKSLETLVKAGSFRPDLYYRLHVFCIELPPLRDRREDIPLLVNHFLNKFCLATSRPVPAIAPEALDVLMRHDWPGNVRELENAVERALVVGRGSDIRVADFSFPFQGEEPKGGKTLEDVERVHIERILRETQHNLSRAARILDIDRTTLYNKLRRYGLR